MFVSIAQGIGARSARKSSSLGDALKTPRSTTRADDGVDRENLVLMDRGNIGIFGKYVQDLWTKLGCEAVDELQHQVSLYEHKRESKYRTLAS